MRTDITKRILSKTSERTKKKALKEAQRVIKIFNHFVLLPNENGSFNLDDFFIQQD